MKAARTLFAEFRTGQGLKGQLLRGGVGSVAVKIGSTLLSVALAVVLARALGAEGFGVYSFVFALITILAIPAQMGLPNLVVRETAKAQAENDWPLINGLWRWATLMALMMSAALIIIGALAAWIFAARLPEGGLAVFYWGLVLVPLIALGNLRGAALRGLRHVVQGQLPEFILRPAFLVVLVLGAHFGLSARALTASDAMMLHALASLAAFIIGAFLLLRARPVEARAETRTATRSRAWLAAALPLGMIGGMQLISANISLITLGLFHEPGNVADFRVAMQGSLLITLGLYAANQMASPHFARLYAQKDTLQLQTAATQTASFAMSLALPMFIVLMVWGELLLTTAFGAEFRNAIVPLMILSTGQLINASAASVALLLSMTDHAKESAYVSLCTTILNIALTFLLVPPFGPVGAAVSSALTVAAHTLTLRLVVRNKIGIEPSLLSLFIRAMRG